MSSGRVLVLHSTGPIIDSYSDSHVFAEDLGVFNLIL